MYNSLFTDKEKLNELITFLNLFEFKVEDEVEIAVPGYSAYVPDLITATNAKQMRPLIESGLKVTISYKNLTRLTKMLKSKGYYHDDAYQIRMREEELIMENPGLKELHDQYKTMLYLMCGEEYNND